MSKDVSPVVFTDNKDNEEVGGFMDLSPKYGEDSDPKGLSAPESVADSHAEKTQLKSEKSDSDHSASITGKPSLSPPTPSL